MHSVTVRNAHKFYGKGDNRNQILNGLNMTVDSGSIYALIGSSGCGKTTLLSAIIGLNPLDDGEITVLGEKLRPLHLPSSCNKIGFMPQDISLHNEFNVGETLNFFGNLYQLDSKLIKERMDMLKKLLDLPPDKRLVCDCSGGEQRRVSLAVTMIHDPSLLILDEPTVGVDPLLREKIWDFLNEMTRTKKIAIIITTHYIEEAEKVNRCGLMRNGVLLAEDSPQKICARTRCDGLSDAFLQLCLDREIMGDSQACVEIQSDKTTIGVNQLVSDPSENSFIGNRRKIFHKNTMKALIHKSFIQIFRQPASVVMIFMTIIMATTFNAAIGRNPTGQRIGFVSDELSSFKDCNNSSIITVNLHKENSFCEFDKLSCRFIDTIKSENLVKSYYNSFEEAYKVAKAGKLEAIIYFQSNFSKYTQMFTNNAFKEEEKDKMLDGKEIQVYLDKTNYHSSMILQKLFYGFYGNYAEKLMKDCNMSSNFEKGIVKFQEPIFGKSDIEMRLYMGPLAFLSLYFFAMSVNTITNFVDDRSNGSWNRMFLSGVGIAEFIFCHSIVHLAIGLFQQLMALSLLFYCYPDTLKGHIALEILFFGLMGMSGLCFGIATGCLFDKTKHACLFMNYVSFVLVLFTGYLWPFEAMPKVVAFIGKYVVFASYPLLSFGNIVHRGFGIEHASVMIGLVYLVATCILFIILAIILLKKKKFLR